LKSPLQDEKATLGWPFSLALNHLLEALPEARGRLAPHAGEVLELRAPPLPALTFTILPGGRIEAGGAGAAVAVTLKPALLSALARAQDPLEHAVEVSGEARLAAEVTWLVRHLREAAPDLAEENLSRLLGDVAAHRLAQGARGFFAWQADAAQRLAAAFGDYLTEEKRIVVGRAEHDAFAAAVTQLSDALERAEARVGRLG
jgi:ubiquinone biosynthesis protein UbiJ